MKKKRSFLQHIEKTLNDRNLKVLDTNRRGNCILAKDNDDKAVFLFTRPNYNIGNKTFEENFLSDVHPCYEKTFRYLLGKHKLKLLVTCSSDRGHPLCQKIVTAEEYHRLKKMAAHIKQTWRAIRNTQKIEISSSLSMVAIEMGADKEWFFQGHEADNMIAEAKQSDLHHFCSIHHIMLYQAQGW